MLFEVIEETEKNLFVIGYLSGGYVGNLPSASSLMSSSFCQPEILRKCIVKDSTRTSKDFKS